MSYDTEEKVIENLCDYLDRVKEDLDNEKNSHDADSEKMETAKRALYGLDRKILQYEEDKDKHSGEVLNFVAEIRLHVQEIRGDLL